MIFSDITWSAIAGVSLTALFPLCVLCGIGVIADRFLELDLRSLSILNVYVLLPPLLFDTLMTVSVSGEAVLRVAGFAAIVLATMAALGLAFARIRRLDRSAASSAVSATTFFNGVNLGFPIAAFAFGAEGLRLASVLIAVNVIPHNGFGMFIAARGAMSTRRTLIALVRMPFLYVLGLALGLRLTGLSAPAPLMTPIHALGQAALPFTLVCIGIELGRIRVGALDPTVFGIVALRLLAAPLIAIAAAQIVGLGGLLRAIVILQASMPSAILPMVYARVFGGNVELISRAVFYSTIGSLFTLPFLLAYLQGGG